MFPISTAYGKANAILGSIFILVNLAFILHATLVTATCVRLEEEIKISDVKEVTQVEIEKAKKSKF